MNISKRIINILADYQDIEPRKTDTGLAITCPLCEEEGKTLEFDLEKQEAECSNCLRWYPESNLIGIVTLVEDMKLQKKRDFKSMMETPYKNFRRR